ncbi:unnamed protein product, partial [Penicillium salamii]
YCFFRSLLGNRSADNLSHGGNESAEIFRRVVGQFVHGNRGHTSQALKPSVDQSTGLVATEVATSVPISRDYMMPPSAIKAENQDLPPMNARKRVADSSNLPQKQRRHSCSASQKQGVSQLAARRDKGYFVTIFARQFSRTNHAIKI